MTAAHTKPAPAPARSYGPAGVVRQPDNQHYGTFNLYRRADGTFTVFDPAQPCSEIVKAAVFSGVVDGVDAETRARAHATALMESQAQRGKGSR